MLVRIPPAALFIACWELLVLKAYPIINYYLNAVYMIIFISIISVFLTLVNHSVVGTRENYMVVSGVSG